MAITLLMNDNDTTTAIGQIAETLAARFMEKRGLIVTERNYRCRGGEIDLVCRDGTALVFVEVRLRRNAGFGGAGASITTAKQRRIILAAKQTLPHTANTIAIAVSTACCWTAPANGTSSG